MRGSARFPAAALGVEVVGTVGIVALLKRRGVFPAAAPVLANLRSHGLRLSDVVLAQVLAELGEG